MDQNVPEDNTQAAGSDNATDGTETTNHDESDMVDSEQISLLSTV